MTLPPAAARRFQPCRTRRLVTVGALGLLAGLTTATAGAQNDPTQVDEAQVEVESKLIEAAGLAYRGDAEDALAIYDGLLAEDPSLSAAAYAAARLRAGDDPEAALKLMRQAYRHDGDNAYVAQALADMLADSDRHGEAAGVYAELFARYPTREDFLLNQSQSLAQAGKPREGLRAIERHLAGGAPLTPQLGQQRFTLAVSMNDPRAAVRALEELMAAYPRNPDVYQELAQFYRRTGDEGAARSVWTQMAERFPDDARARVGLAGQSKLNDAEEDFLARLGPLFADESVGLDAKILQLMPLVQEVASRGDTVLANRAVPLARRLTEVHPDEAKAHAILADLLLHTGRPGDAIEAYRATLERDRSVYLVWDQLLLALAEAGRYDELLATSDDALLLFPNQGRLYYYNGRALAHTGDLAAAENTLLQGTILALDDQVLLYDTYEAIARIQLRQARFADAVATIERAIGIRPKHGPGLAVKAEALLRTGEETAAREVLAQAAKEAPRHPYVMTVEALAALESGDTAAAANLVEGAMRYGGGVWADAHEVAGDVAYLRGDTEAALASWRRAEDLGGGSVKLAEKLRRGEYVK